MASTIAKTRSGCHVAHQGRSKVKRDKQSSTPEEDSGVQLEDSPPATGCTLHGQHEQRQQQQQQQTTKVISLPGCNQQETKGNNENNDAMTVQASDNVWCPAPPQHVTSAKNSADQKSRDANSVDRKPRDRSADSSCDRNRTTDLDRKSRVGAGRKSDIPETTTTTAKKVDGEALLKVPTARVGGGGHGRRVTATRGSASATEFLSSGGGGGGGSGGSEPETDGESEGASFLSAPETMPPKKPCRDTRNKMRFKKFFRPLRRTKSIGNAKEASSSSSSSCTSSSSSSSSASSSSAFAFHNKRESDSADDRRSVDTGRGSMEPLSDREIEEEGATEKEASNKDRQKKKSIATEMKEKLEVLRRRYADLTTNQKEGKSEKPSAETIKNWSKAIEHLLADKFGLQCFHAFLKSEFSEENIEFWMACEAYKGLKASKQQQQAQKIFAEYITHQAPREINIDSVTRDLTCSKMVQPDPTTFDAAQKRIQALMDKDSYPRFIQSTLYQELVSGTSPLLLS